MTTTTSFVLQQHNKPEILHALLKSFRSRLDKQSAAERASSSPLLQAMQTALSSTPHSMIYWPLVGDEYHTKTCIYDNAYERDKKESQCFHLVRFTDLLPRLHPTKSKFIACHCINHAPDITLNWQEFIYPQFVELLYKKYDASTPPPSSPTSILSLSASSLHTGERKYINDQHNYNLFVTRDANYTEALFDSLFRDTCSELYALYKNESIATLGRENVDGARHFKQRLVDGEEYKLLFKMKNAKIRIRSLGTTTTGSNNNSISTLQIHHTHTEKPFVLLINRYTLKVPNKGPDTRKEYRLFVPTQVNRNKRVPKKRCLSSDLFCEASQFCLLISCAPLVVELREGASFVLATPGSCRVDLRGGVTYDMEMWSHDAYQPFPLRYEVASTYFVHHQEKKRETEYFAKLHMSYHTLFHQTPLNLQNREWARPVKGYVDFYSEPEWHHDSSCFVTQMKYRMLPLNQYGTHERPCYSKMHPEFATLRVYFKESGKMPIFLTQENKRLTLVKQKYRYGHREFPIYGLCKKKGDAVWCYFFLNDEKTFILFIPLD
jgi:hypothetical protein